MWRFSVSDRDQVGVSPPRLGKLTYILGLFGAVVAGVSVKAAPRLARWGASEPPSEDFDGGSLSFMLLEVSASSTVGIPSSEEGLDGGDW